jgi:CHAT domain-containing protein/tetratricopeptide (TPR) repeat protein
MTAIALGAGAGIVAFSFLPGMAGGDDTGAGVAEAMERCQLRVRDDPGDLDAYHCFWAEARRLGAWDEAARRLEALLAIDSTDHRARLYLAAVEEDRGGSRAGALYREALAGFVADGNVTGEIYARISLSRLLRRQGRGGDAGKVLAPALSIASAELEPELRSRVRIAEAWQALGLGDYGRALGPLLEAEEILFPDGPANLRSETLAALGFTYWGLGMARKGIDVYEQQAGLMRSTGDRYGEAAPRYNIALLGGRLLNLGEIEHAEYVAVVEEALAVAVRVGHRDLEAKCSQLLGQEVEPEAAARHFERALELSLQTGDRRGARQATWGLAQLDWMTRPERREEALLRVEGSVEDARSLGDLPATARALAVRAFMAWDSGDRDAGIEAYRHALDAVERIRDLQPESSVRARVFTQWTFPYYRFSGALLAGLAGSPDPDGDLELAFRTMERMRARVLLDELDGAGARPHREPDDEAHRRHEELLERISEVQKLLGDPELSRGERRELLAELERLEVREMVLRDERARLHPEYGAWIAPEYPTLEQLRGSLAEDEAMLLFQLSRGEVELPRRVDEGGSWVVAVTRQDARIHPLPDNDLLENQIGVFLGLLKRRDGSEGPAAERLYRDLLGDALRALDAGQEIEHLIFVPDRRLHRLPFEALRDGTGEPLVTRRQVSYAPSAAIWMRWVAQRADAAPPVRGLAFADPEIAAVAARPGERGGDPWLDGLGLEPLPHARKEAAAMARGVGNGSRVLTGADASERALKSTDLERYGLLHFAAHAVVDDAKPERSAVLLSPGSTDEDGMLQIREIVDLDLTGRVVVLTACRSASGTVLEGEGVIGLARAFFQAGARGVVGALWPLRDDEAARLIDRFGDELSRGRSLAAALAEARAAQARRGAPAASWAGIVLLGDGDHVPLPRGRGESGALPPGWAWALGALGLVLVARFALKRRRRRAPAAISPPGRPG